MTESEISRRTAVAGVGAIALSGLAVAGCETGGGNAELGTAADIPVGGGKVFADADVVVTQPQEGTFNAFSATCTHRGCTVKGVANGTINCECHGSRFTVEDGSVAQGPATEPLERKQVLLGEDGKLTLA